MDGFLLELMFGESDRVLECWVRNVFLELEKLGLSSFTSLAAFGPQSSGKSSTLNAMFQTDFLVSDGACTRGINARIIPHIGDKHILVIDVEGICSTQGRKDFIVSDNRLACLAIIPTDITMMIIKGEDEPVIVKSILENISLDYFEEIMTKVHFVMAGQDKGDNYIKEFELSLSKDLIFLPKNITENGRQPESYVKEVISLKSKILPEDQTSINEFVEKFFLADEHFKKNRLQFAHRDASKKLAYEKQQSLLKELNQVAGYVYRELEEQGLSYYNLNLKSSSMIKDNREMNDRKKAQSLQLIEKAIDNFANNCDLSDEPHLVQKCKDKAESYVEKLYQRLEKFGLIIEEKRKALISDLSRNISICKSAVQAGLGSQLNELFKSEFNLIRQDLDKQYLQEIANNFYAELKNYPSLWKYMRDIESKFESPLLIVKCESPNDNQKIIEGYYSVYGFDEFFMCLDSEMNGYSDPINSGKLIIESCVSILRNITTIYMKLNSRPAFLWDKLKEEMIREIEIGVKEIALNDILKNIINDTVKDIQSNLETEHDFLEYSATAFLSAFTEVDYQIFSSKENTKRLIDFEYYTMCTERNSEGRIQKLLESIKDPNLYYKIVCKHVKTALKDSFSGISSGYVRYTLNRLITTKDFLQNVLSTYLYGSSIQLEDLETNLQLILRNELLDTTIVKKASISEKMLDRITDRILVGMAKGPKQGSLTFIDENAGVYGTYFTKESNPLGLTGVRGQNGKLVKETDYEIFERQKNYKVQIWYKKKRIWYDHSKEPSSKFSLGKEIYQAYSDKIAIYYRHNNVSESDPISFHDKDFKNCMSEFQSKLAQWKSNMIKKLSQKFIQVDFEEKQQDDFNLLKKIKNQTTEIILIEVRDDDFEAVVDERNSHQSYAFQSCYHTPTYIRAHPGGNGAKVDLQSHIGDWETFTIVDLDENRCALKSFHETYICAHPGGNGAKVDLQSHIGAWETFTIVQLDGNHYALKSFHGTYIRARQGGEIELKIGIGPEETFTIIYLERKSVQTN